MVSIQQVALISLFLGLVSANHLPGNIRSNKRHHARAPSSGNVTKRGDTFTGRATWFNVGLGACGQYNNPFRKMVALNFVQYGDGYPGPQCFKSITIEYNGKQQVASIQDECPQGACDSAGQLDMSTGLFQVFEDLSVGEFQMTWWFNDDPPSGGNGGDNGGDGDQGSTTSTDPAPWTSTQTSTSTSWSDPAPWTSTTSSTTSTTTSSSTSSTSSSPTSTSSTASDTGSSVTATGTPTTASVPPTGTSAPQGQNVAALGNLVVALGEIVVAGGHA